MDNGEATSWLSLAEASQRLGASVDSLRKRIKRGQLEARPGNDGRIRVLVASGQNLDEAGQGLDGVQTELAILRDELVEALTRASRAEGELAGFREALADVRTQLDRTETRADRLEAALADARKSWLARLLEAVRRR
jgi:chromosome segregation ATPase